MCLSRVVQYVLFTAQRNAFTAKSTEQALELASTTLH